jgi:Outer membrane protein beta-barrel domain
MQSPEFEKKVQQKMEELEFSPSATVWTNVQKQVRQKQGRRKRRVGGVIFFVLLALSIASVYFVYNTGKPRAIMYTRRPQATGSGPARADRLDGQPANVPSKPEIYSPAQIPPSKAKSPNAVLPSGANLAGGSFKNRRRPKSEEQQGTAATAMHPAQTRTADFDPERNLEPKPAIVTPTPDLETREAKKPDTVPNLTPGHADMAAGKSPQKATQQISKTTHRRPWKLGFTASPGLVSPVTSLHQEAIVATGFGSYVPAGTYLYPGTYYSSGAYPIKYSAPNKPSPHFSFSGGLFLEKPISTRFSLSIGLNYHFYSTLTKTGAHVDSTIAVVAYGYNSTTKNGYYQQGTSNVYANNYHFLELPLVADYLISKTNKLPLLAEAGLSLGELIGSNALQYDYTEMVYFEQPHALAQTQLSASTALLVGLHSGHISYRLGPQIQYELSNLLKSNNGDTQHLLFIGIKFAMMPWQK